MALSPTQKLRVAALSPFILAIVTTLLTIFFYFRAQPEIPLFISRTTEDQQLAVRISIAVIPIISWCIALIHTLLISTDKRNTALIKRLFYWSGFCINIVLLLVIVRLALITL